MAGTMLGYIKVGIRILRQNVCSDITLIKMNISKTFNPRSVIISNLAMRPSNNLQNWLPDTVDIFASGTSAIMTYISCNKLSPVQKKEK